MQKIKNWNINILMEKANYFPAKFQSHRFLPQVDSNIYHYDLLKLFHPEGRRIFSKKISLKLVYNKTISVHIFFWRQWGIGGEGVGDQRKQKEVFWIPILQFWEKVLLLSQLLSQLRITSLVREII